VRSHRRSRRHAHFHVGDVDVACATRVSLTIEQGRVVAIVGASGSGKSTLMAILGCLDGRRAAAISWVERTSRARRTGTRPPSARQRLGFVFQSFQSPPAHDRVDNVALPLFIPNRAWRIRTPHRAGARRAAIARPGDRERNTPAQLSGGQQQRVAIARALINAPSLLLADEPTGNLDTRTSHEIMDTLVSLNRQEGVTIVVVTHEADIAAYANRVITMRDGSITPTSRPASTMAHPADTIAHDAAMSIFRPRDTRAEREPPKPSSSIAFGLMILATAAQAIGRNKMRSALTMLGIFVGVAALIAMVAIGQGANEAVTKQIESLGTNLVVVLPGATGNQRRARRLRQRLDAHGLRRASASPRVPRLSASSPI